MNCKNCGIILDAEAVYGARQMTRFKKFCGKDCKEKFRDRKLQAKIDKYWEIED